MNSKNFPGYPDKSGVSHRVEMDKGKISKKYLKSWFTIDMISTFPFDYSMLVVIDDPSGKSRNQCCGSQPEEQN